MEVSDIVTRVIRKFPTVQIGIHAHNDSGCGVANSLIAVAKGATHVQGTINGLGERCGNANLCTLIPDLMLKMGKTCIHPDQLAKITGVSIFISEVANLLHDERQPFVGECAFSHKGGAHIDGVIKDPVSFEHTPPNPVGNIRRYVLSDQAGGSAILEKIKKIKPDIDKKDPLVRSLLRQIKDMEYNGYQFEAAEGSFQLLVRKALGKFKEAFEFKGFRVIIEKRENNEMYSEATIKVKKGNAVVHTAAEGDGPVNALDNAVRKALLEFYPQLRDVRLEDFKVRVLDGRDGTAAQVRVLIESHDKTEHWGTVGLSPNIIEAAWIALIDSLNYKLMKGK
jgi:2-isopropylmalate synthase